MLPTPSNPSSFTWQQRFDLVRRQGAQSVQVSPADALIICRSVSSRFYTYAPWQFTLLQSEPDSIPCRNMAQDYPGPNDIYRLTRAWFYVPTAWAGSNANYANTLPPFDDPSQQAYNSAQASAAFIAAMQQGGGTPVATIWPPGGFTVVKRLPINLYPYSYTSIHSICQMPNGQLLRLSGATAVSDTQPFELQVEYQPMLPPMTSLGVSCWFPDDYAQVADEGLLYWLYKFNNDNRAGTAVVSGTQRSYSGQLAVWMAALEAAASAERAGSVDTFLPESSLGADTYGGTPWFV